MRSLENIIPKKWIPSIPLSSSNDSFTCQVGNDDNLVVSLLINISLFMSDNFCVELKGDKFLIEDDETIF
jgi:hypothetical protein